MDNILRLVKAADYDRYILGLLQPSQRRARWMALTAFHSEIAKLPQSLSDPTLGLIRIAWWREALEELKAGSLKKRHEVTEALAAVPELPFQQMELLLNAYEAEIENPIATSLNDLEQRILRTTHVLHEMLYEKADANSSLRFGLVNFLKSIYPLARLGKPPFPIDMANPDNFGSASYLAAAKTYTKIIVEKAAHAPAPMGYYLKQAKKADYNLLQQDISHRSFSYYITLFTNRAAGR